MKNSPKIAKVSKAEQAEAVQEKPLPALSVAVLKAINENPMAENGSVSTVALASFPQGYEPIQVPGIVVSLIRKGYVTCVKAKGVSLVSLTKKGKEFAALLV